MCVTYWPIRAQHFVNKSTYSILSSCLVRVTICGWSSSLVTLLHLRDSNSQCSVFRVRLNHHLLESLDILLMNCNIRTFWVLKSSQQLVVTISCFRGAGLPGGCHHQHWRHLIIWLWSELWQLVSRGQDSLVSTLVAAQPLISDPASPTQRCHHIQHQVRTVHQGWVFLIFFSVH